MTDTAPAYAQALDQLRAERDAAVARAESAERQWATIAGTPDGSWHVAYERAAAQLAEVTAERDAILRDMAPTVKGTDAAAWANQLAAFQAELATLRAMFHAAIDAAGRVP